MYQRAQEQHAIMNSNVTKPTDYLKQNRFSLGFALDFSVIYYGLSQTWLSQTPRYLELLL